MRNNFDLISELIDNRLAAISNKADREQLFFFVFLLQRKKDIEELHKSTHIVKMYQIKDRKSLLAKRDEIVKLCEVFQCRAMINLNPKSYKNVAFDMLKRLPDLLQQEHYARVEKLFASCVSASGIGSKKLKKYWIIDIAQIEAQIKIATPAEENKIIAHIPSKTGMHLITTPFDVTQVTLPASVELKKDCLTNLFIY